MDSAQDVHAAAVPAGKQLTSCPSQLPKTEVPQNYASFRNIFDKAQSQPDFLNAYQSLRDIAHVVSHFPLGFDYSTSDSNQCPTLSRDLEAKDGKETARSTSLWCVLLENHIH